MKKSGFYILLLLFVALWACNDEPEFPDPGLDATRTSIDTVRRDTIDEYLISMNISAPNGVDKIQVLNGRNYEVIEEFSEYYGQKELTFDYVVDLREIETDTTLLYIVKVIDQSARSYNKGFTLCVKKFSSPDITIVGKAEVLGLVSPVFELKALFETGLNTIASYRVLFEGEVIDENSFPDTLMHEYAYKQVLDVEMEEGREYLLEVELTDDKGTVGHEEMKLRLVKMTKPVKVTVGTQSMALSREMELFYDEEERLDSIYMTIYSNVLVDGYMQTREDYYAYVFCYTEENMVSGWVYTDMQTGEESNAYVYTYLPGTKRVKSVDSKTGSSSAIDIQEWYDHDGVKSFYVGTNPLLVDNIHYTSGLKGEEKVFSEYVSSSNRTDAYRQHAEDMTAILIPTYFPELPPVMLGSTDKIWQDLFFYKYVFTKTLYTYRDGNPSYPNGNEETSWVSYSTDTMGRLIKLRRTTKSSWSTSYNEYIFTYE